MWICYSHTYLCAVGCFYMLILFYRCWELFKMCSLYRMMGILQGFGRPIFAGDAKLESEFFYFLSARLNCVWVLFSVARVCMWIVSIYVTCGLICGGMIWYWVYKNPFFSMMICLNFRNLLWVSCKSGWEIHLGERPKSSCSSPNLIFYLNFQLCCVTITLI